MKTVGEILKTERIKQGKTILQIHEETKISQEALMLIEADDFFSLPPMTFVKGFIRNYAKNLNLNPDRLLAVFRRDWQQVQKGEIVSKSLVFKNRLNFSWNPKLTLIIFLFFIFVLFLVYIGIQLKNLIYSPKLVIENPIDNQEVNQDILQINGKTDNEVSVYINDQLIDLDKNNNFSYKLKLFPGENIIEIKAIDRKNKKTVVIRKVKKVDKNN